jgi:hypothetical protein
MIYEKNLFGKFCYQYEDADGSRVGIAYRRRSRRRDTMEISYVKQFYMQKYMGA